MANQRLERQVVKISIITTFNNSPIVDLKEKEKMRARRLEEERRMKEMERYEVIRKLKGI